MAEQMEPPQIPPQEARKWQNKPSNPRLLTQTPLDARWKAVQGTLWGCSIDYKARQPICQRMKSKPVSFGAEGLLALDCTVGCAGYTKTGRNTSRSKIGLFVTGALPFHSKVVM